MNKARDGMPVVIVNPTAPVGDHDWKPTPTGKIIVNFLNNHLPAFVDTGLNLVDARDVAMGHLLAAEHGRCGERYILGCEDLTLEQILGRLAGIAHKPAPTIKIPFALAYAAGAFSTAWANVTGQSSTRSAGRHQDGAQKNVRQSCQSSARIGLRAGLGGCGFGARRRLVPLQWVPLTMAILVVAAESFELQPFAASLENLRKLKWPLDYAFEGVLRGVRMILVAHGAGPKLAAKAVDVAFRAVTVSGLSASKIHAVLSVGLCGALTPDLDVNDIVVGSQVIENAGNRSFSVLKSFPAALYLRTVLSQDSIANTAAEKDKLGSAGAIAVEMEAAGVAAKAEKAGLPFACIKVVSDNVGESFPFNLNEMRTTEGRIARGKIGMYVLTHPTLLPKLLELKRRSGRAARTLGDFLVSCTISSEAGETFHSGEPADA